VLHFHYGRFQEVPRLENLYQHTGENADVGSATLVGNPFLDAKTTISYEVGVEHQFWGMSIINLTFFYRDIFGWVGTDQEEAGTLDPRNPPGVTFVNLDYGSSQGVEFSLRKHMTPTGRWSGGVTYTYSQARGSSSSETQGFNVLTGGQDRAPITELPLDYDRPHVLSGNLYVTTLGVWGLNVEASYSSGSPYTPQSLYDKEILVENINKGRLPDVAEISFRGDKRYEIYGQEFSLFLEGRNITNRKNVFFLNPAGSIYYNVYYTEYGQLGGAYNLRDVRQDLDRDVLLPLHDPQVYDEPRSFRAGIQFDW
jgi:outer membrane receptor protein involved in Fe transport